MTTTGRSGYPDLANHRASLYAQAMTVWRPSNRIRVIAIGLHWRGRSLLAAEVLNDAGQLKGVRPLGGAIEFGETWQQALAREFREELQVGIIVTGAPSVMENIYHHEGSVGHEVVFAATIEFADGTYDDRDEIVFAEDDGVQQRAGWFDFDDLDAGGPRLFPTGLKAVVQGD
ncbi:MAG: NUDIX domain-containing protein [Pseudomonadota bacterium]